MSVIIRLARYGSKKRPFYRIVVADNRFPRDGRFLENVGSYNPLIESETSVSFKKDRIKHWIEQGAACSDTVRTLLKNNGFFADTA